ncbi:D-alanine--D-alanine ligase [Rubrivirga sp. IMCC43871]|uniref:D-alanine--D-alanine ligase n=1 Tax=Rubrivirga sp. IMCC43871 TaxID=3391575 RepID=UPI00398FF1CF
MRVGLLFDRFGDAPRPPGAPDDWDAEYEPEETVAALEAALTRLGHTPVRIGNARALLAAMARGPLSLDAAVNIAESYGSRNREAHVPVLLELAGVPCVGSDALSLSVSLDKHLTKTVVAAAGVAVPAGGAAAPGDDVRALAAGLAFPVIVKPRYEGTAKGISRASRCADADALAAEADRQLALYGDVVVEAFVDGPEFTVGVVGTGADAGALPPLQRAVDLASGIGIHALDEATDDYRLDGDLSDALDAALADAALSAHRALDCRDFSRSDFRVGADGRPVFIEINPLPTFAPDGTFAILAELAGQRYESFLADVLGAALTLAVESARNDSVGETANTPAA